MSNSVCAVVTVSTDDCSLSCSVCLLFSYSTFSFNNNNLCNLNTLFIVMEVSVNIWSHLSAANWTEAMHSADQW